MNHSVNHKFLLARMKSFDLSDVVVWCIEANLSGRVSRAHIRGELAGIIPMRSGVPQGSVIGQLVYLLFANSLTDALEALTLLFEDDVQLITPRKQNM